MKLLFLLILVLQFLYVQGQNFARTKKTYTGKNCEDCLLEGRNHCLLKSNEGLCCDKSDPVCRETTNSMDPSNPCAEDVNYDT